MGLRIAFAVLLAFATAWMAVPAGSALAKGPFNNSPPTCLTVFAGSGEGVSDEFCNPQSPGSSNVDAIILRDGRTIRPGQ